MHTNCCSGSGFKFQLKELQSYLIPESRNHIFSACWDKDKTYQKMWEFLRLRKYSPFPHKCPAFLYKALTHLAKRRTEVQEHPA